MSITYKPLQLSLRDLIASATRNPTVLVPDLQRTFVWKPSDVRFLVDSILRGWPFGTLLLWEIKESYYSEGEGIPSRPFWRDLVDRTCRENPPASKMAAPAVYQMVLDGQQRVQSLVIALGEDSCGFKLFDHEWVEDLRQTRRERTTNWSRASLCVDLVRFEEELAARDKSVRRMETSAFLEWVVRAPEHQSDRSETNHTLPRAWHTPGRYIRLSRIWDLADGQLSESDYRELLRDFLPKQDVSDSVLEQIVPALAVFMCRVGDVRGTARADCLQIESLSVTRTR